MRDPGVTSQRAHSRLFLWFSVCFSQEVDLEFKDERCRWSVFTGTRGAGGQSGAAENEKIGADLTCRIELSLCSTSQTGSFSSLTHAMAKTKTTGMTAPRSTPFGDDFRTSKKDKRQIKHAGLMSKIAKNATKTPKKRRASKKLVANLESLADALPDAAEESHTAASQVNVIKQNTLRHKPGALKRREKMEKVERDRFAMNMAQMSGLQGPTSNASDTNTTTPADPTASRFAALRNFISSTMEQQPVFKTNK